MEGRRRRCWVANTARLRVLGAVVFLSSVGLAILATKLALDMSYQRVEENGVLRPDAFGVVQAPPGFLLQQNITFWISLRCTACAPPVQCILLSTALNDSETANSLGASLISDSSAVVYLRSKLPSPIDWGCTVLEGSLGTEGLQFTVEVLGVWVLLCGLSTATLLLLWALSKQLWEWRQRCVHGRRAGLGAVLLQSPPLVI